MYAAVPTTLPTPVNGAVRVARSASLFRLEQFRQAEVEHFHPAVASYHHVRGFQVAMDDACLVRPPESVGDLHAVAQRLGHAEPARRDDVLERSSFGVLHDDEVDAAFRTDVVDGDDVGVVECARSPRLLEEASFPVRIDDSVLGKDLDGHCAIEVGVEGLVNDTHPTLAELRFDLVVMSVRPITAMPACQGYLRLFRQGMNQFAARPL